MTDPPTRLDPRLEQRLLRAIRRLFPWWPDPVHGPQPRDRRPPRGDRRGPARLVERPSARRRRRPPVRPGRRGRRPTSATRAASWSAREDARELLEPFFEERTRDLRGRGSVERRSVGDLRAPTSSRADGTSRRARPSSRCWLRWTRRSAAVSAHPDHIVHVASEGGGKMCPATEPELPLGKGPRARPHQQRDGGHGHPGVDRRHRLVPTPADNGETPWLDDDVDPIEGDLETVNPDGHPPLRRARHLRRGHHPLSRAGDATRDRGRPQARPARSTSPRSPRSSTRR